jgi:membrane protein
MPIKEATRAIRRLTRSLWVRCSRDRVVDSAAQVSYYALLSLFPFLFVLALLIAWLPLDRGIRPMIEALRTVMPPPALGTIQNRLADLVEKPRPDLLVISAILSIWSASRGVDAIRRGLNRAYRLETRRGLSVILVNLAATLGALVLALICIAVILIGSRLGPALEHHFGFPRSFAAWTWLRWPATAFLATGTTAMAYAFVPDSRRSIAAVVPGAIVFGAAWMVAVGAYSWFVASSTRVAVTYGAIGNVVVLMIWIFISATLFFACGHLNAILAERRLSGERDDLHRGAERRIK